MAADTAANNMAGHAATPFAGDAEQNMPQVVETVDAGKPTQYQLVKSPTGKTYVEVRRVAAAGTRAWAAN
jgi:hypothetical protein